MFNVPEKYRFTDISHSMGTSGHDGNNGLFLVPYGSDLLQVIASNGLGWEHVSVTTRVKGRKHYAVPTWEIMCYIKSVFWSDEDIVIQYHPRKSDYVNNHEFVLHLWRPTEQELPVPDSILVGVK